MSTPGRSRAFETLGPSLDCRCCAEISHRPGELGHLARFGDWQPGTWWWSQRPGVPRFPSPHSEIAHRTQDAYPAFNLSTISTAAAGQAFVNPKKGPKSRDAAKPGKYRPGMEDSKYSSSAGNPSTTAMSEMT